MLKMQRYSTAGARLPAVTNKIQAWTYWSRVLKYIVFRFTYLVSENYPQPTQNLHAILKFLSMFKPDTVVLFVDALVDAVTVKDSEQDYTPFQRFGCAHDFRSRV